MRSISYVLKPATIDNAKPKYKGSCVNALRRSPLYLCIGWAVILVPGIRAASNSFDASRQALTSRT